MSCRQLKGSKQRLISGNSNSNTPVDFFRLSQVHSLVLILECSLTVFLNVVVMKYLRISILQQLKDVRFITNGLLGDIKVYLLGRSRILYHQLLLIRQKDEPLKKDLKNRHATFMQLNTSFTKIFVLITWATE